MTTKKDGAVAAVKTVKKDLRSVEERVAALEEFRDALAAHLVEWVGRERAAELLGHDKSE